MICLLTTREKYGAMKRAPSAPSSSLRTSWLLVLCTESDWLIMSGIFADKSPGSLSPLPLAPLHAPLDAPHHLSHQHKIDGPEEWACQHAEQTWPVVDPRPQYQPRHIGIYYTEDEHPAKLTLNIHLGIVAHKTRHEVAYMRVGIESEHLVLL